MTKDISTRHRFIRVYNYSNFSKKTKNKVYSEIQGFSCSKAPTLEKYFHDELKKSISVFIVYDTNAQMIIGYYTLMPACMIRNYEGTNQNIVINREIRVQKNVPCIELEKFAINEKYLAWLKQKNYNNKKIGHYLFWEYISKTIVLLSEYINFSFVILHAIKHKKVIQAYKNMGFETFEDDEMNIVSLLDGVASIKEEYVDDCQFMYLSTDSIFSKLLEGGMYYV